MVCNMGQVLHALHCMIGDPPTIFDRSADNYYDKKCASLMYQIFYKRIETVPIEGILENI